MIRVKIQSVLNGIFARFTGTGRPGESFALREMIQHYGFKSRPLEGAEGIALQKGNAVILIATGDRRYTLELENGEVAIHNHEGSKVHLRNNGVIEVNALEQVNVVAPVVNLGDATGAQGVVTRECLCAFTGGPHPDVSTRVKAVKL